MGRRVVKPGTKDVKALIKTAAVDAGIELKVLNAVEAANDAQKHVLGNNVGFAYFGIGR